METPQLVETPSREDGHGREEEQRQPYYWESGGNANVPWLVKVQHHVAWGGLKALEIGEIIGEGVATALGLTQSKYQYVIDALEADKWREERIAEQAAEREAAAARARETEEAETDKAAAGVELGGIDVLGNTGKETVE